MSPASTSETARPPSRTATPPPGGSGRTTTPAAAWSRHLARWVPGLAVAVLAVAVLATFEVTARELTAFVLYLTLGLAVPGALWWRALRGRAGSLAEDLAGGLAVGYAVEVLTYVPARAVGAPRWFLLWPVLTLVVFALAPPLRRYWRGGGSDSRQLPRWSWLMSVMAGFVVMWSMATFYRSHGLTPPGNLSPYFDMPFHLALAAGITHRIPAGTPYVLGEPLNYHWFLHADLAATHWATGIELQTLLYRLSLLPMLLAFVVLVGVVANRVIGAWWSGPAVAALTLCGTVATPYPWTPASVFDGQTLNASWLSPTNVLGLLLFLATLLVVIDLVRGKLPGRRPWVLLAVLLIALGGAKATFLPMLLAGLLLTVLGVAVTTRRLHRPAAGAAVVTALGLLFALLVLFGGQDGGLGVDPFRTVKLFPIARATGLSTVTGWASTVATITLLLCALALWSMLGAGAFGLLRRPRALADPVLLMLVGVGLSGIGALLAFMHPGWSQLYFLRGASPVLALLVVAGLVAATGPADPDPAARPAEPDPAAGPADPATTERSTTRAGTALAGSVLALAVGFGAILVVRAYSPTTAPTVAKVRLRGVVAALTVPILVLLGAVVVVGLLLLLAQRRFAGLRGLALPLTLLVAMGTAVPGSWSMVRRAFRTDPAFRIVALRDGQPELTADGLAAARWLRAHSHPDDLVATNAHCRQLVRPACDNRHFWVSAYAERRMLVEGWAYTGSAGRIMRETNVAMNVTPFWDPERLADNDAVFQAPTRAAVITLRDRYGVRWLFSDGRQKVPPAPLDGVAQLGFRNGQYSVYSIPS